MVKIRQEEEYIENMCAQIVALRPDIVITEKVYSLVDHFIELIIYWLIILLIWLI